MIRLEKFELLGIVITKKQRKELWPNVRSQQSSECVLVTGEIST